MKHYYALWVVVTLLTAACVFSVLRVQDVQAHQNDAIESIICHAESFIKADKKLTLAQRNQSLRFYRQSLADARLPECG